MSTAQAICDSHHVATDTHGALSLPLALGSGPLRAVIKDNFDVAGLPTSCGSERFSKLHPAKSNAETVGALLERNVRIVGRARMHELAYGVTGVNSWSGTPTNPVDAMLIPGGSSSGSAVAVASGLADFALGTDTGGSVRVPAACCGIIGLKTTFGRVSRKGVVPNNSSLDCVGVFASDFAMIDRAMDCIAPDYIAGTLGNFQSIGVASVNADADVQEAFETAVNAAGLPTDRVVIPTIEAAFTAGLTIMAAEMWEEFGWLAPDYDGVGSDVAERLQRASQVDSGALRAARDVAETFALEIDSLLGSAGFLLLPTLPSPPPTLKVAEDPLAQLKITQLVRPFNVSGHPAISFPVSLGVGKSTNLQVVGRRGSDAELCTFASRLSSRITHQIGVSI
jgi:amidase